MATDDQDMQERRKGTSKRRNRKLIVSGVAGALVGVTLFALAAPTFSNLGWMNDKGESEASEATPYKTESAQPKLMNLDIRTGFVDAVDKASEAVVGVINIQRDNFSEGDAQAGTGSGVIYKTTDGKAYVVTNHHVIEGANRIEVSLSTGKKVAAELLGSDMITDLAVLQIDKKYAPKVIEIGNSKKVRRGQPAIAIGNPLGLEFAGTVTQGVISANERILPVDLDKDGHYDWQVEVLQTDAAINPGNSGGALVNADGQLIGINSMKISAEAVEGIGLAIPMARALPIMGDLETKGKVSRPYLGVELRSLHSIPEYHLDRTLQLPRNVTGGVAILDVKSPSPALSAGLREYDVITAMDGKDIRDIIEFRTVLYSKNVNDTVTVEYYRGSSKKTEKVKLAKENF